MFLSVIILSIRHQLIYLEKIPKTKNPVISFNNLATMKLLCLGSMPRRWKTAGNGPTFASSSKSPSSSSSSSHPHHSIVFEQGFFFISSHLRILLDLYLTCRFPPTALKP